MACYLIDDEDALKCLLGEIQDISNDPPSFYIDTEGSKLGRFGTMDLLQFYVLPLQETFIVDVFTLKRAAFDTLFQGNSLRMLLESPSVRKIFFDVRNDADALFSHYNIALSGVVDLQMMEYFQEGRTGRNLAGLRHCIEKDSVLPSTEIRQWDELKASVRHLMHDNADPEVSLFQRRPLDESLILYAAGDVVHLPSLYQTYCQRLTTRGRQAVHMATEKRLQQSMQPTYDPQGKKKGKGPYRILGTEVYKHVKAKSSTSRHDVKKQKNENSLIRQKPSSKAAQVQEVDRHRDFNNMNTIIAPLHGLALLGGPLGTSTQAQQITTTTTLRHQPIAFVKEGQAQKGRRKKGKKPQQRNRASGADTQQDHDYFLDDLDWTLCDKDCGWCGRCYNGFDFGI